MNKITVPPWSESSAWSERKHTGATDDDYDTLIDEPTQVFIEGHSVPFATYGLLPERFSATGEPLRKINYNTGRRTNLTLTTRSTTFGNSPRRPMRSRDWASSSSFNKTYPELYQNLLSLSETMSNLFSNANPAQHRAQSKLLEESVCESYRLGETPFTGGIINLDCAMNYHKDKGNFKDSWNIMGLWKKGTAGGVTVLLGPRLGFAMKNNSFLLFPAQTSMHGVTKVYKEKRDSYRVSVVFYAVSLLKNSLPPQDERLYAQSKRTEREQRRAGLIP